MLFSPQMLLLVLTSSGAAPKIRDDPCYSGGSTLGGTLQEIETGCDLLIFGGYWQLLVKFFRSPCQELWLFLQPLYFVIWVTLKASLFRISR